MTAIVYSSSSSPTGSMGLATGIFREDGRAVGASTRGGIAGTCTLSVGELGGAGSTGRTLGPTLVGGSVSTPHAGHSVASAAISALHAWQTMARIQQSYARVSAAFKPAGSRLRPAPAAVEGGERWR